jgi:hypothetical protein
MNNADNLNFRGKFRQYDADGKPYLYRIGDVVEYKGAKYVALTSTSSIVPTTSTATATWKALGAGGGNFYIQDVLPSSGTATEGDRWYRPDVSVLYTLIKQENDMIWVEL